MAAKQDKGKIKRDPVPQHSIFHELLQEKFIPLIIFSFSFLIYFNSVFNSYNLDDELVTQNHRLTSKGISAIPEIFTSPYYEDKAGYKYEYRPIVLVSFAIEHTFLGENPHTSHLINVLLYSLLCVYLFHVLSALLKGYSPWFVAAAVLIFAAHPVHTEVVASIKNRDELLAVLFSLAALHMATRYVLSGKLYWVVLVPLLFCLGVLSKTTALVFGVLIPIVLIALTNAGYLPVILLTILLAIPTLAFSRLYSVLQQGLLVVCLMSAVTLLYAIKNYKELWIQIKAGFMNLWTSSESIGEEHIADSDGKIELTFLKNLSGLIPFVTVLLALTIWCGIGIRSGNPWNTVMPFVLLATWFTFLKRELKPLLLLPVTLLVCYAMFRYRATSEILETPVIIFLASQFLFNEDRRVRIFASFCFLVYATVSVLFLHSFFFLTAFVFIGFYRPKLRLVSVAIAVILVIAFVKGAYAVAFTGKHFSIVLLRIPILVAAFLLCWYAGKALLSKVSPFLLGIVTVLYFALTPPPKSNAVVSSFQHSYFKLNEVKAVELTPVQEMRLLKKIEYPLEKNAPWEVKLGTSMVVLGKYLKLILVPYPLAFYYGYSYIVPTGFFSGIPLLVFGIHITLLCLALWYLKRYPLVSISFFIYIVSIIIFSGLFIPVPGMMGDRFLFIPSIGVALLFTHLLFMFFGEAKTGSLSIGKIKPAMKYALAALLIVYSLVTIVRNTNWRDRVTLFRKDINAVEQSAQAQNLLGLHLMIEADRTTDKKIQQELLSEAIPHFQKAIEIYPEFLNASYDLGRSYEKLGRVDQAYEAYNQTVQIDTNFYAPLFSMGIIQDQKGNTELAIKHYEKYLKKYPNQKEVYANLSYAYFKGRKFSESINTNKRLLYRIPNLYEPTINIAKTYLEMGVKDSAYKYFIKAYQLNPRDPNVSALLQSLKKQLLKSS